MSPAPRCRWTVACTEDSCKPGAAHRGSATAPLSSEASPTAYADVMTRSTAACTACNRGTATPTSSASSITAVVIAASSSPCPPRSPGASRSCDRRPCGRPRGGARIDLRVASERRRDREDLVHDLAHERARGGVRCRARRALRRSARSAGSVRVAHQLDPDLAREVGGDRALEPAGHHRLAERLAALRDRAVRLADREARALDVADDARARRARVEQ